MKSTPVAYLPSLLNFLLRSKWLSRLKHFMG